MKGQGKSTSSTSKGAGAGVRAYDGFFVVAFIVMGTIAGLVDFVQALGAASDAIKSKVRQDWVDDFAHSYWPPAWMIEYFGWWCEEVDPLLMVNPLWYKIMAVVSPFVYLPFYVVACYAFIKGRNWIRTPGIVWASCLLYSMVVILSEELFGPFKSPQPIKMLPAYLPYVIVPALLLVRLWPKHPFGKHKAHRD